jgi:hypothetical protein
MQSIFLTPSRNPFITLYTFIQKFPIFYNSWFCEGSYIVRRWVEYSFANIDVVNRKRTITIPETWLKIEENFNDDGEWMDG